jgi:hypothetical protein
MFKRSRLTTSKVTFPAGGGGGVATLLSCWATGFPQLPQKAAPAFISFPQFEQNYIL